MLRDNLPSISALSPDGRLLLGENLIVENIGQKDLALETGGRSSIRLLIEPNGGNWVNPWPQSAKAWADPVEIHNKDDKELDKRLLLAVPPNPPESPSTGNLGIVTTGAWPKELAYKKRFASHLAFTVPRGRDGTAAVRAVGFVRSNGDGTFTVLNYLILPDTRKPGNDKGGRLGSAVQGNVQSPACALSRANFVINRTAEKDTLLFSAKEIRPGARIRIDFMDDIFFHDWKNLGMVEADSSGLIDVTLRASRAFALSWAAVGVVDPDNGCAKYVYLPTLWW